MTGAIERELATAMGLCSSRGDEEKVAEAQEELARLLAESAEMREALLVASRAISIANDWNLYDVQVEPPARWGIECEQESEEDGWCRTRGLAKFLRELAAGGDAPPE